MDMLRIEVGKPYLPALGLGEGVRFDVRETGCELVYGFDAPAPKEVAAMKAGQQFEIRFAPLGGIIWVTSKCGSLEWTDAPYNPRLSGGLPDPSVIKDNSGLGLILLMLDSRDAVVKSGRFIGLGTEFSRVLLEEAARTRQQAMTARAGELSIAGTMAKYTTKQLAEMARPEARFRL